jgi:hypothetical protein
MGRRSSITLEDLRVLLRAQQNRVDEGPPANSKIFRQEIEMLISFLTQFFGTDPVALSTLGVASSKLVVNQPGAALTKIESVLVRHARWEKKQ